MFSRCSLDRYDESFVQTCEVKATYCTVPFSPVLIVSLSSRFSVAEYTEMVYVYGQFIPCLNTRDFYRTVEYQT